MTRPTHAHRSTQIAAGVFEAKGSLDEAHQFRQRLCYLLAQLETSGYLKRTPEGEKKTSLVSLTERGRKVVTLLRSEVRQIEAEWIQVLGPKRFKDLVSALKEISALP